MMQLFPATTPITMSCPADGPVGDSHQTHDPANAEAFQAALSAANQNARSASERTGARTSPRTGSPGAELSSLVDAQTAAESEADTAEETSTTVVADAATALLPLIAPPPQPAELIITLNTAGPDSENGDQAATAPIMAGTTTDGASATTAPQIAAGPATTPMTDTLPVDGAAPESFRAALQEADGGDPVEIAAASVTTSAPAGADSETSTTTDGIARSVTTSTSAPAQPSTTASSAAATAAPADATTDAAPTTSTAAAASAGAPTIATVAAQVTTPAPATGIGMVDALPQGATATAQAINAPGVNAQAGAQTVTSGSQPNAQAAATAAAQAADRHVTVADAGPSPTWTELASSFGAQIVASSGAATGGGGATRTAGATPGAGSSAQVALSAEAPLAAGDSTAPAAGASVAGATAVTLPGQAVAATGARNQGVSSDQGFTLGLADAAEATTAGATSGPATSNTAPEFNLSALTSTNVGPATAASSAQVDASAPAPVATQIADGAVIAARNTGQSVELILQPEGLGTVTLKVTVERGGVAVHMAVDNPDGRELVHHSWPQLQAALEQRGVTVQSLQLDLTGGGRGSPDQFGAFQQFANQQQRFAGFSQSGQQARSGSNGERRGVAVTLGTNEPALVSAGAGSTTHVDYRI